MINTLTSLRLLFALMVFGAHCYVVDSRFSIHAFKEGFVGVSSFFILSGFIIAYNYQKKIELQKVTKRQFWAARIARIYPLHLLTLVGVALIGNYIAPMGWIEGMKYFIAALFLLHPFIPTMDYFFYFNSPSWSLGCEQLFYFLFPFLALIFYKKQRLLWTLLVCVVVIPICMSLTDEANIRAYWYVNPLTRFPDFLISWLACCFIIFMNGAVIRSCHLARLLFLKWGQYLSFCCFTYFRKIPYLKSFVIHIIIGFLFH